jgi:hypothetical protein
MPRPIPPRSPTSPTVAELAELADRYVALWNETDAGARRAAIATLWVPEGEHFVRTLQVKGYEALEQRVIGSHEKNVRYGGFRFRATGDAQLLQNAVMFHWEMVPAAGGRWPRSGWSSCCWPGTAASPSTTSSSCRRLRPEARR